MAIGFLFGLPALRTRGVNLAVVTFGLGFAVFQLVFSNSAYTENARVQPTDLSLFGLADRPGRARRATTPSSASAFLVLAALAVANLRRGRDRPAAARRTHQRARGRRDRRQRLRGQALRVHALGRHRRAGRRPARLRLLARSSTSRVFQPGASISVLVLTVIGSAGYLAGPMLGSLLASGGLVTLTSSDGPVNAARRGHLDLAAVPADRHRRPAARRADPQPERRRRAHRRPDPAASGSGSRGCGRAAPEPLPAAVRTAVPARTLAVSGLTQRFGGFTALEDVSLARRPRRGGRPARPERRRQDHADRLRRGQQPAHRRLDHLGRRGHHPLGAVPPRPGRACPARSSHWSSSTTSPCARTCSPPPTRATGSPT